MNEDQNKFTERQKISMNAIIGSSKLFDKILEECGLDKKRDYLRWKLVRKTLREGAEDRIVRTILASMRPQHVEHFESLLNSHLVANPNFDFEAVLFQLAIFYPDIQGEVFESLEDFFRTFVKNYKDLYY